MLDRMRFWRRGSPAGAGAGGEEDEEAIRRQREREAEKEGARVVWAGSRIVAARGLHLSPGNLAAALARA